MFFQFFDLNFDPFYFRNCLTQRCPGRQLSGSRKKEQNLTHEIH